MKADHNPAGSAPPAADRDIDIGKKIQASRKEAGMTQETAAEMLGVSRQTISNWENEKSYPDIISVIRMSDLYDVSLDYLLKGVRPMSRNNTDKDDLVRAANADQTSADQASADKANGDQASAGRVSADQISADKVSTGNVMRDRARSGYYEYLDESTNVVRSNTRKSRMMLVLSYLLIWSMAMIVYWFFTSGSDAMGYSLMFLWIILPVTTFVITLLIGLNDYWGRGKWLAIPILSIMYMLAEYGTFSISNTIAFHKINKPEISMIVAGMIIGLAGMLAGMGIRRLRQKR